MAKGRPPTPTPVLKVRGTFRPDRHGSRTENIGDGPPVRPPHLKGEARKFWDHTVARLAKAGIVDDGDTVALTHLSELHAGYRKAAAVAAKSPGDRQKRRAMLDYHHAWVALAQQFGLTPAARAKLKAPAKEAADDFEEFLNGGKKGA